MWHQLTKWGLTGFGLAALLLVLGGCGDKDDPKSDPVEVVPFASGIDDNACHWPDEPCEPKAREQLEEIRRLAEEDHARPENASRERITDELLKEIQDDVLRCLKPTLRGPTSDAHVCDIPEACDRLQGIDNTAKRARLEPDNPEAKRLWEFCNSGLDSFPDER